MHIFHEKLDTGKYRATFDSNEPILLNYCGLIEMAKDLSMTSAGIEFCLQHEECPTPINHDDGADGAPEDGIWVYDRMVAFLNWIANHSAYAPMLTGARTKARAE